jgi:hypothetical protein
MTPGVKDVEGCRSRSHSVTTEEENADQLLNQVARSLMSVAKMPAAIEQSGEVEPAAEQ